MTYLEYGARSDVKTEDYVSATAAASFLPFPQNSNRANTQIGVLYRQYQSGYTNDDYSTLNVETVGEKMTTPTREEIDAKLAAAEARTETRFVELSGKMERIIDAVDRSNAESLRRATETKDELRTVNQNLTKEGQDTRRVIIGGIIASVLTAVPLIWATQANLLAAFQSGISLHEGHITPPKP
jgi:hypothetical protein